MSDDKELSISDATLIARLRLYGSKFHHEFGHNDAADRIAAFLDALEKLAQAVQFTEGVIRHAGNSGDDYLAEQARETLAEIKST